MKSSCGICLQSSVLKVGEAAGIVTRRAQNMFWLDFHCSILLFMGSNSLKPLVCEHVFSVSSLPGIVHKLWIEQPEDFATSLATKPYPKSAIAASFKKLQLCKASFS